MVHSTQTRCRAGSGFSYRRRSFFSLVLSPLWGHFARRTRRRAVLS